MGERVVLLTGTGLHWPDRDELRRQIRDDERPDVLTQHFDPLLVDEAHLRTLPGVRGAALRRLPLPVAQAAVAFSLRHSCRFVLTWSEPATLLYALLLVLSRSDAPHVSVHCWITKAKKAVPLRLLQRGITRLVVPAPTQRRFLLRTLRVPADKVPEVRWPVDVRFWRPDPRRTELISAVGREMRDYPTLVEAVRGLPIPCRIAPGAVRDVANPWLSRLGDDLPDTVTLHDLRGAELRELYARSRFTVVPLLPGDSDNGITAILESFAMGRPVICTRTAGQVGVVQDGVNGLLVPPGDPAALRAAVLRLWHDPDECDRLGANGRRLVEQEHTLEQWTSAVWSQGAQAPSADVARVRP